MQTVVLNAPLAAIGWALARFGSPAVVWHAAFEAASDALALPVAQLPEACRWSYAAGTVVDAAACCAAAPLVCVGDSLGSVIVGVVGVLPYLLVATVLSSVWAGQAAARAHAKRVVAGIAPAPAAASAGVGEGGGGGAWDAAAQGVYRALLMALMNVLVAVLDGCAPWLPGARLMAFTLCALVTGFTAVDAAWALGEVPLATRLRVGEERWAWILGFGLVPAAGTFFGPPALNGAVYNVAFPCMVLTALSDASIAVPRPSGSDSDSGRDSGAVRAADAAGAQRPPPPPPPLQAVDAPGWRLPWLTPFAWLIVAAVDGWPRLVAQCTRWVRRRLGGQR